MTEPSAVECHSDDGRCITCGDEGIVVRVVEFAGGTARCVDQQGVIHAVVVDLVGGVRPGDWLLAHAGVALTHLPPR